MNDLKNFKILSIDGGGIKGLYSATVLALLEEEFCQKTGKHISDYFDMICGTSTGGLIALALSVKTPAIEIANFYRQNGKEIFPNHNSILSKIKQYFWRGTYKNSVLKSKIETVVMDKTMAESHNLLCIPSFCLTKSSPTIWKFPHKEGNYTRDAKIKMSDVALSTSAAPTYFPVHEIHPHGRFIDGGVWANNPTLCGVQEAIEFFINQPLHDGEVRYNNLQVLSISSVNKPSAENLAGNLDKSFLGWGDKLFTPFFEGQAFFTDRFMTNAVPKIYPNAFYHRIPSPNLSPEQSKYIDLDKASNESIALLEYFGNQIGHDYQAAKRALVSPFFQQLKTYKTL